MPGTGRSRRPWHTANSSRQKKALEDSGHTLYDEETVLLPFGSPQGRGPGGEARQAGLAPYEYLAETPEKPAETRETGRARRRERRRRARNAEIPAPANGSGLHNGLNLQMIDGLYRRWARRRPEASESDPLVLRIYDLCRQEARPSLCLPETTAPPSATTREKSRAVRHCARTRPSRRRRRSPHSVFPVS